MKKSKLMGKRSISKRPNDSVPCLGSIKNVQRLLIQLSMSTTHRPFPKLYENFSNQKKTDYAESKLHEKIPSIA